MSTEIAAILARSSLFSQVNPESQRRLVRMAVSKEYGRGETIFHEGEPTAGVFVVASGLVRIFKLAPSGKEHVLHLAGPGATFAEVAVLGEFAYPANAEAVEPATCVLLPSGPFLQALREDHQLSLQILSGMAMWVRSLVGLLEGVVLRDAVGRVASYLLSAHAEQGSVIALPALKKHIASHLNLTSETLSRTLRQLREERLIRETEDGLVIEDLKGLQGVSEGYYPRL